MSSYSRFAQRYDDVALTIRRYHARHINHEQNIACEYPGKT